MNDAPKCATCGKRAMLWVPDETFGPEDGMCEACLRKLVGDEFVDELKRKMAQAQMAPFSMN